MSFLLCLLILFLTTATSKTITIDDQRDPGAEPTRRPRNTSRVVYHVIDRGESLFLDELEECKSNAWFKIGKNKQLRTKRVYANSSSAGVYYCRQKDLIVTASANHHLIVVEAGPEIVVNNPPLVKRQWSNVSCRCTVSFKSYAFLVSVNLLFGEHYIFTEAMDSYKFKPTVMNLTSTQEMNDNILPHMNGSVTCLWLFAEKLTVERKWMELARITMVAEINVPAANAYPDHTFVSPERAVTCSAHAIPPVYRCKWKSHVETISFVTDETGCIMKIFNPGNHLFTCTAFNLIAGKAYNATWSGEVRVIPEGQIAVDSGSKNHQCRSAVAFAILTMHFVLDVLGV